MAQPARPAHRSRREPALTGGNSAWAVAYGQVLKEAVTRYAERLPRSVQRHLGPSELGHECDRLLIGKMAGVPRLNFMTDPWASIVGTAIHAFMEEAFNWDNADRGGQRGGHPRWRTEYRVTPDPGAFRPHPGTADLYDFETLSLIDHKGIALDTPVPTPAGWTTMRDLREGDQVLGAEGRPCRVARTYPAQYRDCYRVIFKNGASLVTDDVQLWRVRRNRNGGWSSKDPEEALLSTREARQQLRAASGQRHLRVWSTRALDLPEAELPVHPYVLGCWLGDGYHGGGQITKPDEELFRNIRDCGYHVGPPARHPSGGGTPVRTVHGLVTGLRAAGLVEYSRRGSGKPEYAGVKRIPMAYLRASLSQRLALLRGLMDTDGSYNRARSQCVYTTTSKELAGEVRELAATLGWKAYTCDSPAHGLGVSTTAYQVMFTPFGHNPFLLTRKASLVRLAGTTASRYRVIQEVEPVLSVATRCIDVDAPDQMYLAGEDLIPVHNCLGDSSRARLRSLGPPQHYYVQMLLYAIGYMHLGWRVDRIVLAAWPRTKSSLDEMYTWEHEITAGDFALVADVLRKTETRERLAAEVAQGRMSIWQVPPTPSSADCHFCPLFRPQSAVDGAYGCPGSLLGRA